MTSIILLFSSYLLISCDFRNTNSLNDFINLVELRKQLSGYETSLSTCNRKAAVKIRSRISILKVKLADCVSDGINAKKVYTDSNKGTSDKVEGKVGVVTVIEGKNELPSNSDVSKANNENNDIKNTAVDNILEVEVEVDVEVDNSIVDRGSELLLNILSNGRPIGTVEEAWERVILAEKMRFNLDVLYGNNEDAADNDNSNNNNNNSNDSSNSNNSSSDSKSDSSIDNNSVDDKINNHDEITELGGDSSSSSTSCLSSKYVAYVNQNYNTPKRIAAVLKS